MAESQTAMTDSQTNDTNNRPVIELFVKAASDKVKNGSCPICHQYFLACYVLREQGLVDLVVTTFLPETPPKDILEFSTGKQYPLVKVHKGVDALGKDMTNEVCDTMDEIEELLDRFMVPGMLSRQRSVDESEAEKLFEDLLQKFNIYMKNEKDDGTTLLRKLDLLNSHLGSNGTKFLLGDRLERADCYLLPRLQHIRVAGYAYRGFQIPTSLTHLWEYLGNAYSTDAFKESCPENEEIVKHYEKKACCRAGANCPRVIELRKQRICLDVHVDGANGVNGEEQEQVHATLE